MPNEKMSLKLRNTEQITQIYDIFRKVNVSFQFCEKKYIFCVNYFRLS